MLVFVDESGDPGRKTDKGSSKYFFVATVVFPDRQIAQDCDECIAKLRSELNLSPRKEFHFNKDRDSIRQAFLQSVARFEFWYSVMALDKDKLVGEEFQHKESLYKYTVKHAFESIFHELKSATVIFDRCGGREFTNQLKVYLRKAMNKKAGNSDHGRIKKYKDADSKGNNLLQLADMVCGAVSRCYSLAHVPGHAQFRKIVQKRERQVRIWPGA